MAEPRRGSRLARESHAQFGMVFPEDFDRDLPIQHGIVRQVERAHPALTERGQDSKPPDLHGAL
jgi:hypothetical protein